MNKRKIHALLPQIICLVAAMCFWLFVMNEQNPIMTGTYTVPVSVRNLDRSLVALHIPETVSVEVTMNRNALMQLRTDNIKAYVDAEGLSSGEYPNTRIYATLPGEGQTSVTPAFCDMKLDTYAATTMPITVNFYGNTAAGYTAKPGEVTPQALTVTGSQEAISRADRAVVSVNMAGKTKSFSEYDSITVVDSEGNTISGIEIMPTQAKITVTIEEKAETTNVNLTAKAKGTPAEGHSVSMVSIQPVYVTVTGPQSQIEKLKSIDLGEIDVTGETDDVTLRLPIPLPDGMTAIPQEADVTVVVDKDNQRT